MRVNGSLEVPVIFYMAPARGLMSYDSCGICCTTVRPAATRCQSADDKSAPYMALHYSRIHVFSCN
jgi:hypothetical protein